MKDFCCAKFLSVLLFFTLSLFGALTDKSAMVYYGKNISYPTVGIHDYIIVQPELTNTKTHGFSLYKDKIYAYVSIGEIHQGVKEYKDINSSWVLTKNEAWKSEVLDIKNEAYQNYLLEKMISAAVQEGFENFFFDTLDSYHLACTTQEQREAYKKALVSFIKKFHEHYPTAKLILNRGFELIDAVHPYVEAVLFESYYRGVGGEKLAYAEVSDNARAWLDIQLKKVKSYNIPIISVEYLEPKKISHSTELIEKIKSKGMIPYVGNRELDMYGLSSKNALKREIFTLIDESVEDRISLSSHRQGALIYEYLGYIQKLHDINKGLPKINEMRHYAGVVIWLSKDVKSPEKFMKWIRELISADIKVAFVNQFGVGAEYEMLKPLDLNVTRTTSSNIEVLLKDKMMSFEIEPSLSVLYEEIHSKNVKPLLVYKNNDGFFSEHAAITAWGGYAISESYMTQMNEEELWVINPFAFFKEALRLETLIVPDTTTENGKRLLFTHIDGDGIMNRVEGHSEKFSGEIILEDILKVYKIPHSVSVIGAEINPEGLYPELSDKLTSIVKDIYNLENVEGATHTFTHPFKWGEIKNGTLDPQYRLKVKDYNFSLEREISQSLDEINNNLTSEHKALANTVYWTGDCIPRENALDYVYSHKILNINGGATLVTKLKPWISYVAPMGVERGEYYQVFTGAQNENVYTNDWLGPFWGFKKVVQTFELTNSPRRFKPIDIYYHFYSGSKMASMKALQYVFDWAIQQDVMPIFTSEYIPKVMDYYTVSMANEGDEWLVEGMKDLKTLRIEETNASVDFLKSPSVLGIKHFENHTYISLDNSTKHLLREDKKREAKDTTYLISSNAKLTNYLYEKNLKSMQFDGHVDLKLNFHISKECKLTSSPEATKETLTQESILLEYEGVKSAKIEVDCRQEGVEQ